MAKQNKLLIETSAVRAKVGPATKAQEQAFDTLAGSSRLYTSTYIRMEFIRRWVCDQITIAVTVSRFRDVKDALVYLEQDFSSRSVKSYIACIASMLSERKAFDNPKLAAEELSRNAYHWLRRFDKCFPSRTQNKTRCQRGGSEMQIGSFATILADLAKFQIAFKTPILDCEVNAFLKLNDSRSESVKLSKLVNEKQVACIKHLHKFAASSKPLTCTECERIGDLLISLEQTRTYSLVHTDGSFDFLCNARGMPHLKLASVRGAQKIADASQKTDS